VSTRYVVRVGDDLNKIAANFGLRSWSEIYNSAENREFRRLRPNPNVIFAGDVLMVPDKPGTFNHMLPEPVLIEQENPHWCWAAAMESWLTMTASREPSDQGALRDRFAAFTNPNGGLTPAGWSKLAAEYNLESRMYSENLAHGAPPPSIISAQLIHDILKSKGFIVVHYSQIPGAPPHTHVIYGIETVGTDIVLLAMDPQKPGGGMVGHPLNHYASSDFTVLMWAR
jgi:hypothetical protein